MKTYIKYLYEFFSEVYGWKTYVIFGLFTGAIIAFNYAINFENGYIDAYFGQSIRILWFALVHAIPFIICLFIVIPKSEWSRFHSSELWVKICLAFLILGFDRSFHYHTDWVRSLPNQQITFVYKCAKYLIGLMTTGLPLLMIYLLWDYKRRENFYGMTLKGVNYKAYGQMMLVMIPLIAAASFLPEFLEYYPKYKRAGGAEMAVFMNMDENWFRFIYELLYLSDFISIELFFRGFLILGLARILGPHVVLPMACTYAVLHFGKPMGETISSVFGAYVLGIIALRTKNIWGGVVLHMGVALFMECFAFLQIYFRS